ncbi:MAG: DUF167 domain-containing protein [Patescibacteria group bacterium]
MQINIRVIPKAKQNKVVQEGENYKVWLTTAPVDGKANKELINILSEFFKLKKSQIEILKGHKSRDKIIEIK